MLMARETVFLITVFMGVGALAGNDNVTATDECFEAYLNKTRHENVTCKDEFIFAECLAQKRGYFNKNLTGNDIHDFEHNLRQKLNLSESLCQLDLMNVINGFRMDKHNTSDNSLGVPALSIQHRTTGPADLRSVINGFHFDQRNDSRDWPGDFNQTLSSQQRTTRSAERPPIRLITRSTPKRPFTRRPATPTTEKTPQRPSTRRPPRGRVTERPSIRKGVRRPPARRTTKRPTTRRTSEPSLASIIQHNGNVTTTDECFQVYLNKTPHENITCKEEFIFAVCVALVQGYFNKTVSDNDIRDFERYLRQNFSLPDSTCKLDLMSVINTSRLAWDGHLHKTLKTKGHGERDSIGTTTHRFVTLPTKRRLPKRPSTRRPPKKAATQRPTARPVTVRPTQKTVSAKINTCLNISNILCGNSRRGNYAVCYPDCQSGVYLNCNKGRSTLGHCPQTTYKTKKKIYDIPKVFDPSDEKCKMSTKFCPRDLEQFLHVVD